jgi:predicted DNA-binding transcriptional regulator AlpA
MMDAKKKGGLLTCKETCERLRIARSTLYDGMDKEHYPRPAVYMGPRSPRWREDEIDAVVERGYLGWRSSGAGESKGVATRK